MRVERRSKPVNLDALAAKGEHKTFPDEILDIDDQNTINKATEATMKLTRPTTLRPAFFSALDLKVSAASKQASHLEFYVAYIMFRWCIFYEFMLSRLCSILCIPQSIQLKKTDSVRSGPFSSTSMSPNSSSKRHLESNKRVLLESPLGDLGKKKFKISDVLNVKLRPVMSTLSKEHKKFDSEILKPKGLIHNDNQVSVNSYRSQSMQVPQISMHSALKAALAKKFDKAVTGSNVHVDETGAESPMSQW